VGLESRSTMFPAILGGLGCREFMATPTSAWARAGASLVRFAGHGHHPALCLVAADAGQLGLGSGLGQKKSSTPARPRWPPP
jgi:hypothetical protein